MYKLVTSYGFDSTYRSMQCHARRCGAIGWFAVVQFVWVGVESKCSTWRIQGRGVARTGPRGGGGKPCKCKSRAVSVKSPCYMLLTGLGGGGSGQPQNPHKYATAGGGGGRGFKPPSEFLFFCLSFWKFLRTCLFEGPAPSPWRIPGFAPEVSSNRQYIQISSLALIKLLIDWPTADSPTGWSDRTQSIKSLTMPDCRFADTTARSRHPEWGRNVLYIMSTDLATRPFRARLQ